MKNKKTTLAGVLTAVGILLTQLGNLVDGVPSTVLDPAAVSGAVMVIFGSLGIGWFAQDADEGTAPKQTGK